MKDFKIKIDEIEFSWQPINGTWGCKITKGIHTVFQVDKDLSVSLIKAMAEFFPELDEELSINYF